MKRKLGIVLLKVLGSEIKDVGKADNDKGGKIRFVQETAGSGSSGFLDKGLVENERICTELVTNAEGGKAEV